MRILMTGRGSVSGMNEIERCEYCHRPLIGGSETRVLQGAKHTFCSEFCFRLHLYDFPNMSYEDIKNMYKSRCVSIPAPDFREILEKES